MAIDCESMLTAKEIREQIAHILAYSKARFEAFKIAGDRVEQWRFLAILLRHEKGLRVSVDELRKDKDFKKLIDDTGLNTHVYVLKNLVARFRNENDRFLNAEKSRKKNRVLSFTAEFTKAAKRYVELLCAMSGEQLPNLDDEEIDQSAFVACLKEVIGFQEQRFWPSWLRFIKKIASGRIAADYSSDDVFDEMRRHAPYWPLLLTAWRHHLGDEEASVSAAGLYWSVYDNMKSSIDPHEIEHCISFLTKESGPKLLLRRRSDVAITHPLNADLYGEHFRAYSNELIEDHQDLQNCLRSLTSPYVGPVSVAHGTVSPGIMSH
jgi:hypothetical protein